MQLDSSCESSASGGVNWLLEIWRLFTHALEGSVCGRECACEGEGEKERQKMNRQSESSR